MCLTMCKGSWWCGVTLCWTQTGSYWVGLRADDGAWLIGDYSNTMNYFRSDTIFNFGDEGE